MNVPDLKGKTPPSSHLLRAIPFQKEPHKNKPAPRRTPALFR